MVSLDSLKWALVVAVVLGAFVADSTVDLGSGLYRTLAWVGVILLAVGFCLTTQAGRSFWKMFGEARTEIRRVVWPTRPETVQTTLLVMATVAVLGLVLWGMDSVLGWVTTQVLG